ncbi:MAG: septum formation protein Maf, partial [Candidatus Eremiobacteraeota bacterium]|nr:septum formation protein Maf [Candidatus Eremiobacteraeota bacterium]
MRELVLASASPRRLELLRSLGFDVRVVPSRYAEPAHDDLTPHQLAAVHAREKAREVAQRLPGMLIVSADTVVDLDGKALGKPRDEADAIRMLRALSGRAHDVHTAFTLIDPKSDLAHEEIESTRVWFYDLDDREIAAYVRTGDPLDKAGAYGIQGLGATLVRRVEGDFYTVMGLPLGRFARVMARLGLSPNGA